MSALHPDLTPERRRELLRRGVELFNAGEYFAAHEVWEEVWRSTTPEPKPLLQGLIQAAAGVHQVVGLGRHSGPRGTLAKALRNLEPFASPLLPPAACLGLAIGDLMLDLQRLRGWLEREEGEVPLPALSLIDPDSLR